MMDIRPVRYTKDHPVGVIVCIAIGYGLSRYGLPFGLRLRGGVSAGSDS